MSDTPTTKHPDITYDRKEKPFLDLVDDLVLKNEALINERLAYDIEILRDGLNTMYALASQFAWTFDSQHIVKMPRGVVAIFSAFHKNMFTFYAAIRQTQSGFYGAARGNMRHIFESLLIAKYCSVSKSADIYERWKEGDMVFLTKGVLNKISKPETGAFKEFWGMLSEYTHATVYAQQVELNAKNTGSEVPINFVFLRTLLDCQYHLLNRHLISPSMEYYTKRYRDANYSTPALREKMRLILQRSNSTLIDRPVEILRNYKATWTLA